MGGPISKDMAALFGASQPEPSRPSLLSEALGRIPNATSPSLLGALGTTPQIAPGLPRILAALDENYRRRSQWEDRFWHWERSESDTETQRIERARDMVRAELARNVWLDVNRVQVVPQGSFTNRTNTRGDADIDLRVHHPHILIHHAPNITLDEAWRAGGYGPIATRLEDLFPLMRSELTNSLVRKFGHAAVDATGTKAIRVKGLESSRSEVDVVPACTYNYIMRGSDGSYQTRVGAAILSTDGKWTINYPDQHAINGRAKRLATEYQFKRVVRIVKRLRADMTDAGLIDFKVPSFLVECLVYNIPDHIFHGQTDRYDRVKAVLQEMVSLLDSAIRCAFAVEVNGIKSLFGEGQAWDHNLAITFARKALVHLGDA